MTVFITKDRTTKNITKKNTTTRKMTAKGMTKQYMTAKGNNMTTKVTTRVTKKNTTNRETAARGETAACFAKREGKCQILDRIGCRGCTFYQTPRMLAKGRAEALLHIAALPEQEREYIRLKYVLKW